MVAHIHDELQLQCKSNYANEVGAIAVQSIKDAGTYFNLRCPLDAEFKIGKLGLTRIKRWCPWPDSNWHSQKGLDFKSNVSTNFTTRAHQQVGF